MPSLRRLILFCLLPPLLAACAALQYQPVKTLDRVNTDQGYRLLQALNPSHNPSPAQQDDVLMVMVFSGGGTRVAAF